MNSLFSFTDYVVFLKAYIENQPKKGRGLVQKLAFHLGVNPTFVSQVLSGLKNFSVEQGFEVTEFLGLAGLEKDYFILLIAILLFSVCHLKRSVGTRPREIIIFFEESGLIPKCVIRGKSRCCKATS